jgi:membrane-associated phospholipid phosphatase
MSSRSRLRAPIGASGFLAMIAATPLGGGHYLVDVIAGILVTILADWRDSHSKRRSSVSAPGMCRVESPTLIKIEACRSRQLISA